MNRQLFVLIHRYIGLVMALFLVIASFTGVFLAFYDELDAWMNQDVAYVRTPTVHAQKKNPYELHQIMVQRYPNAEFARLNLETPKHNKSVMYYLEPKTNPVTKEAYVFENDEVFVNPYTGETLGTRKWGDITQGAKNLMPFLYRLHYSLALDVIGVYTLGIIALLWTLDCFIGFYLTLPQKQKKTTSSSFTQHTHSLLNGLSRWSKSWKIRWFGGLYKVNFDLHRAGGLWLWAMLFVFAWSGVGFNLQEVHNPVTRVLFKTQRNLDDLPVLMVPLEQPALDFKQANFIGKRIAMEEAILHKFSVLEESSLHYISAYGVYEYCFRSSLDIAEKHGQTRLYIDGNTGNLVLTYYPSKVASGDTFNEWMTQLHTAGLWGLPMQIFVSFMGLAILMLSFTGIYIWFKKRNAKLFAKRVKNKTAVNFAHKT